MTEINAFKQAAARERNRLLRLLKASSPFRAQALKPVCENVGWMKAQLDRAREEIGDAALVVEYQHGKDQSGTMINPAYTAYEMLFKSYVSGLAKILDALPPAAAKAAEAQEPKGTVLALVRARKEGQA